MDPLYHPITTRRLSVIKPQSASYIFTGSPGTGRRLAATMLTQRLNCAAGGGDSCAICQNIISGTFADLKVIDGAQAVGIENIQELQQNLAQRPFSASTTRVVIIEADAGITREAQNRLLKTLEEPPSQTIMIIIAPDAGMMLETVQSRCQIIQFIPPASEQAQAYLAKRLGATGLAAIEDLRPATIGSALKLAASEEARKERAADLGFARSFLAGSVFQRLVMSGQIKARIKAAELVRVMASLVQRNAASLDQFRALEQTQTRLLANVGPRAALEALALAL